MIGDIHWSGRRSAGRVRHLLQVIVQFGARVLELRETLVELTLDGVRLCAHVAAGVLKDRVDERAQLDARHSLVFRARDQLVRHLRPRLGRRLPAAGGVGVLTY